MEEKTDKELFRMEYTVADLIFNEDSYDEKLFVIWSNVKAFICTQYLKIYSVQCTLYTLVYCKLKIVLPNFLRLTRLKGIVSRSCVHISRKSINCLRIFESIQAVKTERVQWAMYVIRTSCAFKNSQQTENSVEMRIFKQKLHWHCISSFIS